MNAWRVSRVIESIARCDFGSWFFTACEQISATSDWRGCSGSKPIWLMAGVHWRIQQPADCY